MPFFGISSICSSLLHHNDAIAQLAGTCVSLFIVSVKGSIKLELEVFPAIHVARERYEVVGSWLGFVGEAGLWKLHLGI